MSRFSTYTVGNSIWAFAVLMLMANTAHPTLRLISPGIALVLSLAIAGWVVDLMSEAEDVRIFRAAQCSFASVPFVWALWVANSSDLALAGTDWLYLAGVSVLSAGVLQIAYWERDEKEQSVSYDLLQAVRPILTLPAALDTGSMRIPR
ncbi:MAG: hypothetical protein KC800_06695 [Candidatus Eremiobacteraeota bacterium]|nr:hypothetical protein [Candidatus Eremiobacteraeota bacterium]